MSATAGRQGRNEDPPRFTVGVVGAGRVGAVLGAALDRAGHRVVAVAAVSEASLARAADLLPGVPLLDVPQVVGSVDLVLLAVPDEALPGLVTGLATVGAFRPGQVVVHTSGRYGIGVLEAAARIGVLPLAVHPAMSFTGTSIDLDRLGDACFAVTTVKELEPLGEALVLEMGGEPITLEEEDRPLYHAGLSLAANHLATLVAQATQLLEDAGVETPHRVLAPLLGAALENALRDGDHALSGPVPGGDAATVAEHLAELATEPQIRSTYRALSRATVELARRRGRLRAAEAESVLAVLDESADSSDSDGGHRGNDRPSDQGLDTADDLTDDGPTEES
ncbi:DUF2520 domain-containing protein [Lapillicoccus sp.]|uniref:Rossmann-like and DUF2520 domain-containing protein n=1 Tax=Lapillicoccus sp. TaxID=1909287 RepID=UPI003266EA1B